MMMIIMPLLRTDTTTYNTTSINDNYTLILIISMILGVKWSSCVHQNPELSRISSEEQREKEIQRAPENRLKWGN